MTFRIATWNLDHGSRNNRPIQAQKEQINIINADVLILTETCNDVDLSGPDGSSGVWIEHHREIAKQGDDWQRIQQLVRGIPFIVAGDFNQARDGRGQYHSSQSLGPCSTDGRFRWVDLIT